MSFRVTEACRGCAYVTAGEEGGPRLSNSLGIYVQDFGIYPVGRGIEAVDTCAQALL